MTTKRKSRRAAVLARLTEPSSLAAFAGLAVLAGRNLDEAQHIGNAAGLVLGVLAVLVPEKGDRDA